MTGSNAILSSQTRTGTFLVAITIIIFRLIIVSLQVETRGQGLRCGWLSMLLNHLSLKSQAAILAIIYLCFVTEFTSKIKHCNMLKMAAYLLLPLHQLDKWMHLTLHFASLLFALHWSPFRPSMLCCVVCGWEEGGRVIWELQQSFLAPPAPDVG